MLRHWEQAPLLQVSEQIWLAAGQMEIGDGNSEEIYPVAVFHSLYEVF